MGSDQASPPTTGAGSTPPDSAPRAARNAARGVPLWMPLLAALLAVGFALAVAAATCGPLSIIVNPPLPPLYPNATLLDAEHIDYGVDRWRYRSADDVCAVVAFYREAAFLCPPPPPGFCERPRTPPADAGSRYVTHCRGRGDAWPFYWTWEVVVREVYGEGGPVAEFDLNRTMYWSTGK